MKKLRSSRFLVSVFMALVMCVCVIPMSDNTYEANEIALKHGMVTYSDNSQTLSELQDTEQVETKLYAASSSADCGASFYRNQLKNDAAYIYDLLEKNITKTYNGTSTISVTNVPSGKIQVSAVKSAYQYAVDAFKADHPEVFWIDFTKLAISYSYRDVYITKLNLCLVNNKSNYYVEKTSNYKYNNKYLTNFGGKTPFTDEKSVKSAIDNMQKKADDCLATVKDKYSTYDVVKGIHDWLVKHIKYNLNYFDQSGYSALVYGQSVCAGYVNAFNYIARQAGIETIEVSGVGKSKKNGSTEDHAWNYVKVGDKWYALDITWDDPANQDSLYHDFFLVGTDTVPAKLTDRMKFSTSHTVHNYFTSSATSFKLPTLSKTAYVYNGVQDLKPSVAPSAKPSATPSTPESAPSDYNGKFVIGDAWQDGVVTLKDAQYVLRGALTLVNLSSIEQEKADVNYDGKITLADAQLILRAALMLDVLVQPSEQPSEQPDSNVPVSSNPKYEFEIIDK